VRARITWAVTLGAGGIFASVVLFRRPGMETDSSRAPGERHRAATVRESPEDSGAAGAGVLPAPATSGPSPSTGDPRREEPKAVPAEPAAKPPVASDALQSSDRFWEELGALLEFRSSIDPEAYRRDIMSRTAEYLGMDRSRAAVFERAAVQSLTEIQNAWRIRDESVLNLPALLSVEERDRRELELQDHYEASKRRASDRLESFLGNSARHDQFRQKLGEWIDAVR